MAKANPTMMGKLQKGSSKMGADEYKFVRCGTCKVKYCLQTNPKGCPACFEVKNQ